MRRPLGYGALLAAGLALVGARVVGAVGIDWPTVADVSTQVVAVKALTGASVVLLAYGLYLVVTGAVDAWSASEARAHDARNVLRLCFLVATAVGLLGVATDEWVGLLLSLGVAGFAVTFALQQPILSLIGWAYILLKRPYRVGDRVRIDDARGDVVDVDFLVTTVWEVGGDLVSGHQPSGRTVTVPNSVVLTSEVYNYTVGVPYVWNELSVQVSYETDLAFAREEMVAAANAELGDEMAAGVDAYREALSETPVDLEVADGPTVNVHQRETWVELRLRYLVSPRGMQRRRNALYEAILARFDEHPERVSYPVGRSR